MTSLLMSLAAALLFAIAGLFMVQSQGLSQLMPSLIVYGLFVGGASFQMLATDRANDMALTYVLVLGLEVILVTLFGIFVLKEGYSIAKLVGIFLVAIGVALLRSGSA
jgi:multidrug transporter EmrE-like cation transporter